MPIVSPGPDFLFKQGHFRFRMPATRLAVPEKAGVIRLCGAGRIGTWARSLQGGRQQVEKTTGVQGGSSGRIGYF